jgi:hypothetical protein
MKLKKGFKNIEEAVKEIYNTSNLNEKKELLRKVINSDLHRVKATKKQSFLKRVDRFTTIFKCDQLATGLLLQDSKSTATIKIL